VIIGAQDAPPFPGIDEAAHIEPLGRHQRLLRPHITNQLIREALHPYPWPSGGAEATSIVEWHMRKASPSTS
jgi:hypothetical protein